MRGTIEGKSINQLASERTGDLTLLISACLKLKATRKKCQRKEVGNKHEPNDVPYLAALRKPYTEQEV